MMRMSFVFTVVLSTFPLLWSLSCMCYVVDFFLPFLKKNADCVIRQTLLVLHKYTGVLLFKSCFYAVF